MIRTVFFLALCFTQGYTINIIVDTNSEQLTLLRGIYSQAGFINRYPAFKNGNGYQIFVISQLQTNRVVFADRKGSEIGYLNPTPTYYTNFPPLLNVQLNVNGASGNLGQVTLSDIAAVCAPIVQVASQSSTIHSGFYHLQANVPVHNNFPVYLTQTSFSIAKQLSKITKKMEVFFFDNTKNKIIGFITPSLSTSFCFRKGTLQTPFTVIDDKTGKIIASGTYSTTGITTSAPVGTAPTATNGVTTVPPGTTVAPTTAPCKSKKNVMPYLKMLKAYKKIKTAAICEDACSQYEPCQYWVWRNSKRATRRVCKLFGVAWKKSKNTVAGEKC